jgi:hypothetical protein
MGEEARIIWGDEVRFSSLIYPPRGINQGQDALRYNPVYCPRKWDHLNSVESLCGSMNRSVRSILDKSSGVNHKDGRKI